MPSEFGEVVADQLDTQLELLDEMRAGERIRYAPATLDAQTMNSLSRVIIDGVVQSLPAFVKAGRSGQRIGPVSTERARLADWLESEEGLQWKKQRQSLWDLAADAQ